MPPKRLERCVKKVRKTGKSKSSSWAICTKSTRLSRKKGRNK